MILSGALASFTTKTGRHDIAEILLKVTLNTKIQILICTSGDMHGCMYVNIYIVIWWYGRLYVNMYIGI